MHPFDFSALSFERHGFWAKETVGFIKKLAHSRAAALGLEPSAEIQRWYAVISCCIQRSNAKILRGEPVPGRPTPLLLCWKSSVSSVFENVRETEEKKELLKRKREQGKRWFTKPERLDRQKEKRGKAAARSEVLAPAGTYRGVKRGPPLLT